jgi:hypothetical protein
MGIAGRTVICREGNTHIYKPNFESRAGYDPPATASTQNPPPV